MSDRDPPTVAATRCVRYNLHMSIRVTFLTCALACATLAPLAGCEKQLFPPHEPRSVYDRSQILRGQGRAANRLNEFGGEEPNVTERLRPLDAR